MPKIVGRSGSLSLIAHLDRLTEISSSKRHMPYEMVCEELFRVYQTLSNELTIRGNSAAIQFMENSLVVDDSRFVDPRIIFYGTPDTTEFFEDEYTDDSDVESVDLDSTARQEVGQERKKN